MRADISKANEKVFFFAYKTIRNKPVYKYLIVFIIINYNKINFILDKKNRNGITDLCMLKTY